MKSFSIHLASALLFFASFISVYCDKIRYDNYILYSVKASNEEQLNALRELENLQDGTLFMNSPSIQQQSVEFIVPPEKIAAVNELCQRLNIKYHIQNENFQR